MELGTQNGPDSPQNTDPNEDESEAAALFTSSEITDPLEEESGELARAIAESQAMAEAPQAQA